MSRLRLLLRNLFRRRQADRDLEAELGAYADEMNARRPHNVRVEPVREEVRAARIGAGAEGWAGDLRYAARMLRKAPALAVACVLTFAIGIGANTLVFSIANELMLRGLPVPRPAELRYLRITQRNGAAHAPSLADLQAIGEQSGAIASAMATVSMESAGLRVGTQAKPVWASRVSGGFFPLMGARPALGTFFTDDHAPVLVLSYEYWQSRFGGDPGVVGRAAAVDGHPVTIIGVAPRGFHGISTMVDMQAYFPRDLGIAPTTDYMVALPIVRLRAGVSLAAAQAELALIARRLAAAHPATDQDLAIRAMPLGPGDTIGTSASSGPNPLHVLAALFLLLSGLVLLLAAANVMGLLLARAGARQREMGVRAALGGSRLRLARQVFLETLLLAGAGAAAGMAAGALGGRWVGAMPANMGVPVVFDFHFDWRVFAYGAALALLMALAAGMVPAWRAASADPHQALQRDRWTGQPRQRLRRLLVLAQVAGSLALLIVGGLFARSLQHAAGTALGFEPDHVVNFPLDPSGAGDNPAQGQRFYDQVLAQVRALPGVAAASLAQTVPFGLVENGEVGIVIDQHRLPPGRPQAENDYKNSPDYFRTLRVPLLAGRDFAAADASGRGNVETPRAERASVAGNRSPPSSDQRERPSKKWRATAPLVAIVNQAFARKYWPGQNPLGHHLALASDPDHPMDVVGVVADFREEFGSAPIPPAFFMPLAQSYAAAQNLQVRAAAGAGNLPLAVENAIAAVDTNVPVGAVQTMNEVVNGLNGLFLFRLGAELALGLGMLGLFLAVVGVYGVVAYAAAQRTHEIGVRMALGARPLQVGAAILRGAVALVAGGAAIGLLLALAFAKLVGTFLVGVSVLDPAIYGLAVLTLGATALAASLIPAWRAMRADPLAALRCE